MSIVGKTIGRYRIIEQLGQGGMAVVYKAYDTRLERDVAVKLIRTETIPPIQLERLLKRFEREAKAQAQFEHPNIVTVYDYGEYKGSPYLVMAYRSGGTLKARIGDPVIYVEVAALLAPIADALAYAHRRDVLHRDVKPSNILMSEEGVPCLTDFGIAKLLGEVDEATLTGTGMGVGTPQYMAPEQWMGKPVPQTDIYALGVVFYELVTGRKPYDADTPAALVLLQATEPLPRPSLLASKLPEHVEKVIYKALAKKPEDRYTSMAEFGQVLAELAQEVGTAPASPPDLMKDKEEESSTDDHLQVEVTPVPELDKAHSVTPAIPVGDMEETLDELASEVDRKEEKAQKTWTVKRPPVWMWVAVAGAVFVGVLLFGVLAGFQGKGPLAGLATETLTATTPPTATMTPTSTTIPSATYPPNPTLAVSTNPVDGAVLSYIPAGEFEMGSEDGYPNERPVHTVYLDAYRMYQNEVTNDQYAVFLNELGNQAEGGTTWLDAESPWTRITQSGGNWQVDSEYGDHPVVEVSWYGAAAYCEWVGGRLPTEAEWEKAARGGLEGKKYPWGDEAPTCTSGAENGTQFGCSGRTVSVGSFAANGYGLYDMAGNANEWVSDWYDDDYYQNSPEANPIGPESGTYRVLRGGSWYGSKQAYSFSAFRYADLPDITGYYEGFRCVIEGD